MSASFAIVSVEDGAAHVLPDSAFTARQRDAIAHIVRHRGVDALPPVAAAAPGTAAVVQSASPSDAIRQRAIVEASRAQGFSGDICDRCGGMAMKRSGTCLTCQECGSTTGCS